MCVNLHIQSVWDVIELGDDIGERKDRMTLAVIYQAVLEDVLLMLAEKDLTKAAWETLQTMHVGVKRVKKAKVQGLKRVSSVIYMMDDESIDDFAINLMTIVSGIRSLGDLHHQ